MKIIEIGKTFETDEISHIGYFSEHYFLDADILFINLYYVYIEFIGKYVTNNNVGRAHIKLSKYKQFLEVVEERVKQLHRYLESGGNLFIIPTSNLEHTFTSDNETVKALEIDFFELVLLRSKDFPMQNLKGKNLVFTEKIFEPFLSSCDCSYEVIYKKFIGTPIAQIKTTNQTAAVTLSLGGGNIILLPTIQFHSQFEQEYDTRVAIALKALTELDSVLRSNGSGVQKISLPDWCSKYLIGNEEEDLNELNSLLSELTKIQQLIENQNEKLKQYANLKLLLAGTGAPLENQIEKIFIEFGYEILPQKPNQDDLIIKTGKDVGVIEIKGVKNTAAEKNAAQLMKWVNNYHIDNDFSPKGILIINTSKNIPLAERTERPFPDQMLPYSKKMDLCLITTVQLLNVYLAFKAGTISFEAVHQLLFNTIGEVEYNENLIKQVI